MSEINLEALEASVKQLVQWKEGTQALEVERAEVRGSQREAVKNLKASVQEIWDAVNDMRLAKESHVNEDGWRKVKTVGGWGALVALIELAKWVLMGS